MGWPFEHRQQSLSMTLSLSGCDSELVLYCFAQAKAVWHELKRQLPG